MRRWAGGRELELPSPTSTKWLVGTWEQKKPLRESEVCLVHLPVLGLFLQAEPGPSLDSKTQPSSQAPQLSLLVGIPAVDRQVPQGMVSLRRM